MNRRTTNCEAFVLLTSQLSSADKSKHARVRMTREKKQISLRGGAARWKFNPITWKLNELWEARSFSAVSTPIFASKYSLESSWRDLQDFHIFAPLRSQNFSQKSSTVFSRMNNEFPIFFISGVEFCSFLRIFDEILSGFRDKFQKRVTCVAF